MSIISLQVVKDMIWDPGTPQASAMTFDTMLQEFIDDIVAQAETEMDLRLNPVTARIVYRNADEKFLWLDHMNVSSVSVWVDPTREFNPGNLVDSDRYTVHSLRGYIERHRPTWGAEFSAPGGWRTKHNTVKIRYDGGFTSATLERDLKRALVKQVVYAFRRRKDIGLSSIRFPDGSMDKFSMDEFLPEVKSVLDRYRRLSI